MKPSTNFGPFLLIMAFLSIVMAACSGDDAEDLAEALFPSTRARVIHLSPDTSEVDVDFELIEVQETIVGLSDKEASPYTEINTGTNEVIFKNPGGDEIACPDDPDFAHDDYTFAITEAGNRAAVLAAFDPVSLAEDRIYTIILLGTFDDGDAYDFGAMIVDDTGDGDASVELAMVP